MTAADKLEIQWALSILWDCYNNPGLLLGAEDYQRIVNLLDDEDIIE